MLNRTEFLSHLLVLALALAVGLFLGRYVLPLTGAADELRVHKLVLVDRDGETVRAILETGASPQLAFLDAQGKRRVALGLHDHPTGLDEDGNEYAYASAFLEFLAPDGTKRLAADQYEDQGGSFVLHGADGLDRWSLRLLKETTWMSFLTPTESGASDRLIITAGPKDTARIQIRGPDGTVAWITPSE
jgi:hypothetical protein